MQVGELIDALEPFRGRGDTVKIRAHAGAVPKGWWQVHDIESVSWDDDEQCVMIEVEA